MLYAYAVTDDPGPEGGAPLPRSGILPELGVERIRESGVAVIASPVPAGLLDAEAIAERINDPEWARERVLAHQAVVTALLGTAAVLPLKFGTLFSGTAALRATIETRRTALAEALDQVRGAREWGVQLFVRQPPQAAPHAAAGRAGPGAGAAFFQRKREARAAEQAAAAALDRLAADSHARLARRARAAVMNRPQPAAVHRRPGEMVLNGAYLVAEQDEAAWREDLAALEREAPETGADYALTGPWAPYNFTGGALGAGAGGGVGSG
ncbi:GvpL/GvpF family gas vesicle protein [Prosthecomicrobium pneumaticum]|uniref:Gas vesicle protein GvpFL n=1 Tax=Prosthecomicrobium pneumaticum TaxID=81895 RepID=A0A7W9CT33_9HYPH|nr:GvpL/GvpF family gas vesicle protein [Prosthecomicrobium pneumaticum]MBB5751385.1 hypothetical protein [Prosthecomicrobium pneumaticum]